MLQASANSRRGRVHTLLLREHNRMCDILIAQHRDWNDERIFQTIRLAMGAKVALIGNAYQMAYWCEAEIFHSPITF
jgi:hypothetical protein